MKKVKGFNFDLLEDKDVLDHIEEKGNQSKYIKELVKKDMKDNNFEELVKIQVERCLESKAQEILDIRRK